MCEYCGCQNNEVIAELTDEHDRLRELSRALRTAAHDGDLRAARELARSALVVLGPHTQVEESALFPAMAREFPDQIAHLLGEHRDIHAALAELDSDAIDPDWPARLLPALDQLFDHIFKEQDGVFPAAVAILDPGDWDAMAAARHAAGSAVRHLETAGR